MSDVASFSALLALGFTTDMQDLLAQITKFFADSDCWCQKQPKGPTAMSCPSLFGLEISFLFLYSFTIHVQPPEAWFPIHLQGLGLKVHQIIQHSFLYRIGGKMFVNLSRHLDCLHLGHLGA